MKLYDLAWTPLRLMGAGLAACRRLLSTARFWLIALPAAVVLLVVYYALANRYTPFTSDAYIQAYVVQVAPQVSGDVVRVYVQEGQRVARGTLLFEIDPRPYEHKVLQLEAALARAIQDVAQLNSELQAARADEARIAADEAYTLAVHEQESAIFKKGSTTERNFLDAVQKHKAAQALLDRAKAAVRQKEEALQARVGKEHALVVEARAMLSTARLNLEWTRVYAPADGYITDLQLRIGSHALAGRPVLACIETNQWWVVANFREGSLQYVQPGQPVGVVFKGSPGQVFAGTVQTLGWGVGRGQGVPSGELPAVKPVPEWVPYAQRFQVRVTLDHPEDVLMRVGATGSVTIYTTSDSPLNPVASFWQHVESWFYYLR